jgi:hypothetical protein
MNSGIVIGEWAAFSSYSAIALPPPKHFKAIALYYSKQLKGDRL